MANNDKEYALSVVTVCYNPGREALETTARSVWQQTARDSIEYLIIDGDSADGTPQLCARWRDEARIEDFVSEPDGGIYDAMNKGAAMARGEWVIFMNAGDAFAAPEVAERLIALAESQADAGVIYGDVLKRGDDGGMHLKRAEPPHNSHRMFFCHQSCMVRRSLILSEPFDLRHRMSADFKMMKRLLLRGVKFVKADFAVACFDTGGVSNTRRAAGLADNMRVIAECDRGLTRLRLLLHIFPTWAIARLRCK